MVSKNRNYFIHYMFLEEGRLMSKQWGGFSFLVQALMITIDYIAIVCGVIFLYNFRAALPFWNGASGLHVDFFYGYIITPIVFILVLLLNNAYSMDKAYWDKIKIIF